MQVYRSPYWMACHNAKLAGKPMPKPFTSEQNQRSENDVYEISGPGGSVFVAGYSQEQRDEFHKRLQTPQPKTLFGIPQSDPVPQEPAVRAQAARLDARVGQLAGKAVAFSTSWAGHQSRQAADYGEKGLRSLLVISNGLVSKAERALEGSTQAIEQKRSSLKEAISSREQWPATDGPNE